jgi:hypothetical protein
MTEWIIKKSKHPHRHILVEMTASARTVREALGVQFPDDRRATTHELDESDSAVHENVLGRTKSNVRVVFDDRELLDGKKNPCGLGVRINWWCQRGVVFSYSAAAS